MGRHPAHAAVRETVRSWYVGATPEVGITAVEAELAFLVCSDRVPLRRAVLTADEAASVPQALAEAAAVLGTTSFEVWIDDRGRAEQLDDALGDAGFRRVVDTVVLALVGPVRARPGPQSLRVEDVVDDEGLRTWVTVKLRGFADSEDPPSPEQIESELSARRAEWPVSRYELAHLGAEPVAALGHHTGRDQMVFLLATRTPFRRLGVAQNLLAHWSHEAAVRAPRSLLINCDESSAPAALYRRIGFTDEVYWHRRYQRPDLGAA